MRRSTPLVMMMVMALLLTMATAAFADRWEEEDALDTDTVDVDVEELDVSVEFGQTDLEVAVGEEILMDVTTTNQSAQTTLADGWNLGLEVEEFEGIDDDNWQDVFELEHCEDPLPETECDSVEDLVTIIDEGGTQIIQVEGLPEDDALDPGDVDTQFFRATFHESGTFTGTVFVFGEPA